MVVVDYFIVDKPVKTLEILREKPRFFLLKKISIIKQKMSQQIVLNASIWGPPFWFFLHTLSITYPETPNSVTKRKYYDFYHNLPLFLPSGGSTFAEMLDAYPVTPYLDCRESLVRWTIFIHNKYNTMLGKPTMELIEALDFFYDQFRYAEIPKEESFWFTEKQMVLGFIFLLLIIIFFTHFTHFK